MSISTSLDDVKAKLIDKTKELSIQKAKETEKEIRQKHFTFQDLKIQWQVFANKQEKENASPLVIMLIKDAVFRLEGKHKIIITLNNSLQQQPLSGIKPALLGFLKNRLKNDLIEIEAEVKEQEESTETSPERLYTNLEKFNYMAKKYPQLNKLKNELGLELDG